MVQQISLPAANEEDAAFPLNISGVKFTPSQFEQLCSDNPELRLELTSTGELIVMPPAGSKTGARNFRLTSQFGLWANADQSGIGFDSSTGFTLPNGAMRAPDCSWIRRERWEGLSQEEQDTFAPLCPDFVVELGSRNDRLPVLQEKMVEYIANGAQLAWLIDPLQRMVYVYRPGGSMEVLKDAEVVAGDPLLPGFILDLKELW